MRLHHLQVQAFGPFAGPEVVDFDAVGASGLYLIHGATGAGKTSILDAICYAVYGAVPGSRTGQRGSIRSDHADPTLQPYAMLEFTAAGQRLRIRRSPEWDAPKKRGAGTTSRPATVLVEVLRGGDWIAQSTRMDETAQIISDHLGLGMEQFAQVVLLPQGEFATFLRAKPEERATLLRRLFDIERFAGAQHWLTDRKRTLSGTVRDADTAIALHGERLTTLLAELEFPAESDIASTETALSDTGLIASATDSRGPALLTTISEFGALAVDRATQALIDADEAAKTRDAARDARLHAETTLQLQQQARQAREVCTAYDERDDERAHELDSVRASLRAAMVVPVVARRRSAAGGLDAAETAVRAATDEVRALVDPRRWTDDCLDGGDLWNSIDAGSSALGVFADLTAQCSAAAQAVARYTTDSVTMVERYSLAAERTEQLRATMDRINQRLTAHPEEVDAVGGAQRAVNLGQSALHAAESLCAAREVLATTQQRAAESRSAYAVAEQHTIDLRQARLSGMVGEIGAQLQSGCPCPVCGSTQHPAPAEPSRDAASAQDVQRAEVAAAAARRILDDADAAIATVRGRHEERAAAHHTALLALAPETQHYDVTPAGPPPDAAPDCDALRMGLAAAQKALIDTVTRRDLRASLTYELSVLTASAADAQQECSAAEVAAAGSNARLGEARESLSALDTRLRTLREQHTERCWCDPVDRSDPVTRHTRLDAAAQRLRKADQARQLAEQADHEAVVDLTESVTAQGFPDLMAAHAALLDGVHTEQVEARITAERAAYDKAIGVLEQPQVVTAEESPVPDLAALDEAAQASEKQRRAATHAVSAADRAVREMGDIATSVQALVRSSEPARSELAVLGPLADTASGQGDNVLRMRLTSYVLAARLESVTALANERLAVMSDGRFTLEHSDELAKGGARSGLSLRVLDGWTGSSRDTATLSGGEAFIASLALALGLGDAVLQDAGGRPLESLFVDEGFGSLDEQTLDQVMSVLDGLRTGGRSVGIVSHVAELRHRIHSTIEVLKTETGSHITAHAVADGDVA